MLKWTVYVENKSNLKLETSLVLLCQIFDINEVNKHNIMLARTEKRMSYRALNLRNLTGNDAIVLSTHFLYIRRLSMAASRH